MSDDFHEGGGEAPKEKPLPPLKLESLGDVDRGLAQLANEIRAGACSTAKGHAVGFVLATLAKLKSDRRDSRFKREVAELHNVLVKKRPASLGVQ